MRVGIFAVALGLAYAGAAYAQTVPATGKDIDVKAIRMACRDESVGKSLKDAELREAVRACVKAKLPEGYAMNGRPGPKMVREACRNDVNSQGLKGPDKRSAVQKCFAEKRPDLAKAEACRKDAKDKGLQGDERKAAVKSCREAG